MEKFVEIFKRYPYWIIGGIVAVVVLIYFMSSGSGGGMQTAVVNVGPSEAQVQANAAQQIAQITTNASTVQAQLALEQNAQDNQAQVALANVAAGMSANSNSTALALANTNAGAAVQINSQNVAAASDIARAEIAAQVAINNSNNQLEFAAMDNHYDTMLEMKQIDAIINSTQVGAQASMADNNLDTWRKGQEK